METKKDLTSLIDLSKTTTELPPETTIAPPIAETLPETATEQPPADLDFQPLDQIQGDSSAPLQPETPSVHEEPSQLTDLSSVKAEVESRTTTPYSGPVFSVYASGSFDEKTKEILLGILTSEDFGVVKDDIIPQLQQNKLFVPQISEYAAIYLCQKIREFVDELSLQPSSTITKEEALAKPVLSTKTIKHTTVDSKSPTKFEQVFITTLPHLPANVTGLDDEKIEPERLHFLGIVLASRKTDASSEHDQITSELFKELQQKAFKLGAHGVIGVTTTIQNLKSDTFRLQAQGTAVVIN